MRPPIWRRYLRFWRSDVGADLDEEVRFHIEAEWGVTENNRRARYYKLTTDGRAHLRAETTRWVRYAETVTGILTATARTA